MLPFMTPDAKYIDNKITMDIPAKISDDGSCHASKCLKQPSVQSVALGVSLWFLLTDKGRDFPK